MFLAELRRQNYALLMVQKFGVHQLRLVVYPSISVFVYIPQVVHELFDQQDDRGMTHMVPAKLSHFPMLQSGVELVGPSASDIKKKNYYNCKT